MSIIAFVPLRGGSKSIPLKNIKLFCEKPLAYWVLSSLQRITDVSQIVIATDSDKIVDVINNFKLSKVVIYKRSAENAKDTSSTEDVMLEYIRQSTLKNEDLFMLVQATSPLTTSLDFEKGIRQYRDTKCDSLLSGVIIKRFFWNNDCTPVNYDYKNRPRRQDFIGQFMENGAFYLNTVGNIVKYKNRLFGKISLYEMPEYTSFELDEPDDWGIVEGLMRRYILVPNKTIKLFLTDVDGVLTDAGMYYSESGDELKKFNTHDGMGISLLRESGIKTGIITSEDTKIVSRRAEKLKVDFLFQGKKHQGKLEVAKEICKQLNISLSEVAYIGDDLNCFDLLSSVGVAACPANALNKIKSIKGINILSKNGGDGVVREFVDWILNFNYKC